MDGDAGDYARRTERIKNLLSSYYGNADPNQQGAAAGPAIGPMARSMPMGPAAGKGSMLDSPTFNPDRHISQMIRSYTVDHLLAEHRGMAREIKNLDSDMQQLVYENYNKFIAATDMIRAMKTNVDGMESDMDRLKTNMDVLAEKSSAVNEKLMKRRQHMEELNRVQQLLIKLQAVFDLPSRMKAALEMDALESAVSFYAEAQPLLRKYGHKGAFRGIAADSEAAARRLSATLKCQLAERKGDAEQVVLLLRQLGEGDVTLQEKYLLGRQERMQHILQEASVVADVMAAVSQSSQRSPTAGSAAGIERPEDWGIGPEGLVPSLSQYVKALDEQLVNALQETVGNVNSIFLQGDTSAARRKPLIAVARDIINQYFNLVRRVIGDAAMSAVATAFCLTDKGLDASVTVSKFSANLGVEEIMQALSAVSTDVGLLQGQLPELSLRDWAAAAIEQAVRGHIAMAFGALEERVVSGIKQLSTQLSSTGSHHSPVDLLAPAFTYMSDTMQSGLGAVLKGLKAYEQYGRLLASCYAQLSDIVQGHLQAMFQNLVQHFMSVAKIKDGGVSSTAEAARQTDRPTSEDGAASTSRREEADPPKTGLVLLLAKLCVFLESSTVPYVMEVLATTWPGQPGNRASDEPPPFVGGEVARRIGTAAKLLLSSYVELHGRSLSQLVQRSVCSTNWLQAQPPRSPRPVCDLLLERLARCEAEVVRLVDNTGGRTAGTGFSGSHQRGASKTDVLDSAAVERGVAKLFRGKVQPFGSNGLKCTQSALLAAVIIVGLKSLMEHIRLQTLGKAGLQQLQMDMFYLRPRLLRLVGGPEAEAVAQLLDEVVAAAAQRSTDPVMLEPATLEKALSAVGHT